MDDTMPCSTCRHYVPFQGDDSPCRGCHPGDSHYSPRSSRLTDVLAAEGRIAQASAAQRTLGEYDITHRLEV